MNIEKVEEFKSKLKKALEDLESPLYITLFDQFYNLKNDIDNQNDKEILHHIISFSNLLYQSNKKSIQEYLKWLETRYPTMSEKDHKTSLESFYTKEKMIDNYIKEIHIVDLTENTTDKLLRCLVEFTNKQILQNKK